MPTETTPARTTEPLLRADAEEQLDCHISVIESTLLDRLSKDRLQSDRSTLERLPASPGQYNAVFGGQIFNSRQQFLVHRPRDVGQDARPLHESLSPVRVGSLDRQKSSGRRAARLRRAEIKYRRFLTS